MATRSGPAGAQPKSYAAIARNYIIELVREPGTAVRPKALLVDEDIRDVITATMSFSDLLQHNVFLVSLLAEEENFARPELLYATAYVLVRPTDASLSALCRELRAPKFSKYILVFSNLMESTQIQLLVNADVFQLVEAVEERYLDAIPITNDTIIFPLKDATARAAPVVVAAAAPEAAGAPKKAAKLTAISTKRNPLTVAQWSPTEITRCTDALISTMLAHKAVPTIRYRAGNRIAEKIATDIAAKQSSLRNIFFDLNLGKSLLLIVDRMDDPLTPLLTPWSYEAMIHEALGIDSHTVDLGQQHAQESGNRHEVLSAAHDTFFAANRFSTWDEVVGSVRKLVVAYQDLYADKRKATGAAADSPQSLNDLKALIENLPDAKKHSQQMLRHMALAGQISEDIKSRNLLDLSLLEQTIACSSDVAAHGRALLELIQNPGTEVEDGLRVALIFALKYEGRADAVLSQVKEELRRRKLAEEKIALVDKVIAVAGNAQRRGTLFEAQGIFSAMKGTIAGVMGEGSVTTQHVPLLQSTIDAVFNGTLSATDYPFSFGPGQQHLCPPPTQPFSEIIVFMVGGATYEEAATVDALNSGRVANSAAKQTSAVAAAGSAMTSALRAVTNLATSGTAEAAAAAAAPTAPKNLEVKVTLCSPYMQNTKQFLAALLA